ncbi:MAG: OmpA family protein [Campylobacterota bacterium]|nr:OmpA family protein [Campylobacterota bacterium]
MKKILLSSAIVAALILTGCSSKDPSIDTTTDTSSEQNTNTGPNTETVTGTDVMVDENTVSGSDSNEMSMSGLESQMQSIYFAFDNFSLSNDMTDKVSDNAQLASTKASSYMLKIEGNCDEWGSDEYNYALGLKRANSAKAVLIEKGVSSERISMISYGESNPTCNDKTKECWAENRRVDFKLLP